MPNSVHGIQLICPYQVPIYATLVRATKSDPLLCFVERVSFVVLVPPLKKSCQLLRGTLSFRLSLARHCLGSDPLELPGCFVVLIAYWPNYASTPLFSVDLKG